MDTVWKITYTTREGGEKTTDFVWRDEKPSENDVAIGIRERLIGKDFLMVDMPRGEQNPTVKLLEHYGYKIVGIERADSI